MAHLFNPYRSTVAVAIAVAVAVAVAVAAAAVALCFGSHAARTAVGAPGTSQKYNISATPQNIMYLMAAALSSTWGLLTYFSIEGW